MKRRRASSIVTEAPEITGTEDVKTGIDETGNGESLFDFQSIQTEKAAAFLWTIAPIILAMRLTMGVGHAISVGAVRSGWQSVPDVFWLGLVVMRPTLEKQVKQHPIILATAVQCAGVAMVLYGLVALASAIPDVVLQHRVWQSFWCVFQTSIAAKLYIPLPALVLFVGPAHLCSWLCFHASVDYISMASVMQLIWGSALASCMYYYHTKDLWSEYRAMQELHSARLQVQAKQDSFQSILSSIFDASCSCDQTGILKEISPHLKEILDIPHTSENLNLCSFAASESEAARLADFFASAASCSHNQALKINCAFRRGVEDGHELVDACLYASNFNDCVSPRNEGSGFFLVFEIQTAQSEDDASKSARPSQSKAFDGSQQEQKTLQDAPPIGVLERQISSLEQGRLQELVMDITRGRKHDDGKSRRPSSTPPGFFNSSGFFSCQQDAADEPAASVRSGGASEHTDWTFQSWRPICPETAAPPETVAPSLLPQPGGDDRETVGPGKMKIQLAEALKAHQGTLAPGSDNESTNGSMPTKATKFSAGSHTSETIHESVDSISCSSCSSSCSDEAGECVKFGYVRSPGQTPVVRLSDVMEMRSQGLKSLGSCHSPRDDHAGCLPCSFHFFHMYSPGRRPCNAGYMCEYCHDISHQRKWRSALRKHRRPVDEFSNIKAVDWLWTNSKSSRGRHAAAASSSSSAHQLTRRHGAAKPPQPYVRTPDVPRLGALFWDSAPCARSPDSPHEAGMRTRE